MENGTRGGAGESSGVLYEVTLGNGGVSTIIDSHWSCGGGGGGCNGFKNYAAYAGKRGTCWAGGEGGLVDDTRGISGLGGRGTLDGM